MPYGPSLKSSIPYWTVLARMLVARDMDGEATSHCSQCTIPGHLRPAVGIVVLCVSFSFSAYPPFG